MSVGNRVSLECDLSDTKVMEGFRALSAVDVANTMGRSCALNSQTHLISSPERPTVAGVVLTVEACPGDNLMLHKALDMVGPGDVIIVSDERNHTYSLTGEIMAVYIQYTRKVRGIILDGPIRDIEELSQMEMLLYATGSTPGDSYKEGLGEVSVPISIGNVAVNPGDTALGNQGGVVIIPRADAAQVLEDAERYAEADVSKVTAVKNGTARCQWIEGTLAEENVEVTQGKCTGQILRRRE